MSSIKRLRIVIIMINAALIIQSCAVLSTSELQNAETLGEGKTELYLNMPYVPNPSVLYSQTDSSALSYTTSLIPLELGLRSGISDNSDLGISFWSASLAPGVAVILAEGLINYNFDDEEDEDDEWISVMDHGIGFDFGMRAYWKYRLTDPNEKVQIAAVMNISAYYAGADPDNHGISYHSISCAGFSPALIFSNKISDTLSFYYGIKGNFYTFDYSSEIDEDYDYNGFILDDRGSRAFFSPFVGIFSNKSVCMELGYVFTMDNTMTEFCWDRILFGLKFIL